MTDTSLPTQNNRESVPAIRADRTATIDRQRSKNPGARPMSYAEERRCIPFKSTDLTGNRVLFLSPHPDDESLACGGTLALHRESGDPVKVIFLTDGALGDPGGHYTREDLVQRRKNEAIDACTILDISDLEFWDHPDRELADSPLTIRKLKQAIEEFKPTLVYAPSPLEFHPDHRAAALITWKAIQLVDLEIQIAFYDFNRPLLVNTLVDISSTIDKKTQASKCYESQLKEKSYIEATLGYNRYRALTIIPKCEFAESFILMSSREITDKPVEYFSLKQFHPATIEKQTSPLVSIVIRTLDRTALLRDALNSVVTQSYPNLELIVVNDGGSSVRQIIEEFDCFFPIVYIEHDCSKGRSAAANSGVNAARGKYINLLDDDDILYSNHVEKLVRFLERTGETFAYSDCEKGDYEWKDLHAGLNQERQTFHGVDFDRSKLRLNNYIPMMCAMFARELWEKSGPFDENIHLAEDWDLWIRMAALSDLHRVPGVTAEYRNFTRHDHEFKRALATIREKYEKLWAMEDRLQQHEMQTEASPCSGLSSILESKQRQLEYLESGSLEEENRHLRDRLTAREAEIERLLNCKTLRISREIQKVIPFGKLIQLLSKNLKLLKR